jgi:hypothetical protein
MAMAASAASIMVLPTNVRFMSSGLLFLREFVSGFESALHRTKRQQPCHSPGLCDRWLDILIDDLGFISLMEHRVRLFYSSRGRKFASL